MLTSAHFPLRVCTYVGRRAGGEADSIVIVYPFPPLCVLLSLSPLRSLSLFISPIFLSSPPVLPSPPLPPMATWIVKTTPSPPRWAGKIL